MKRGKSTPSGIPSRWIRSKAGTPAYVVVTTDRTAEHYTVLRLRFADGVTGAAMWTVPMLDREGARWLKSRPRDFPA